jgi:hypothetical protein
MPALSYLMFPTLVLGVPPGAGSRVTTGVRRESSRLKNAGDGVLDLGIIGASLRLRPVARLAARAEQGRERIAARERPRRDTSS